MDLEVVTVGTELLLGLTVDTNAAELARALASVGARVVRRATVSDHEPAIRDATGEALRRTGFVIVTGGLGPTSDDLTRRAVAALFEVPLEVDEKLLKRLEQRFEALKRGPMPPSNRSQAEVPQGATVLENERGTAPGLWMEGPLGTAVLLPGVPHEMRGLLAEQVIPRLEEQRRRSGAKATVVRSRTLRTTGITESALASDLGRLGADLSPVTLAFLPGLEGVDLRLTAWGLPAAEADEALERAVRLLRPRLREHLYGEGETDLAAVVLELLGDRGLELAVAESCTGGLLGARITAVPGSSNVFVGGVVCYSNDSKIRDLGVPAQMIERHGAVSDVVASAMVRGAMQRFGTQAGLAVTGIAGPAGGTPEKPVGTVWLSARVGERERAVLIHFPGDREQVRQRSAQAALDLLRRMIAPDAE